MFSETLFNFMFTETLFEFMFAETLFNFMFTGLMSFGNPTIVECICTIGSRRRKWRRVMRLQTILLFNYKYVSNYFYPDA